MASCFASLSTQLISGSICSPGTW